MKIRMVTAFNTRMPRSWIDYQREILNDSTWGVGNLHDKQNYTEIRFQSKGGCLKQTNNKNIPVFFFLICWFQA